jgi:hypothetical protein
VQRGPSHLREFLTRKVDRLAALTTFRLRNQAQQNPGQPLRDPLGGEFVETALRHPQAAKK